MEISNRERSFNELFSLLDRVTELLKTELKSKGSNSYRVYCLINFIKFYHYIIFNEPEIFEISEKAFTDNLIRVIDLSSQYCILNCNQLFKIKIGNLEQNKTVIEIIFELYIQYILNCKESLESFKNLLLNFNSFFYDNKFRSDKQYSIFYSNNYLRYLLSQKKIKEKSETVLAKYNTILNYNKNIFISEEKFEINFNTYFLKLIIDAQKKFQNNNDLNKQLVNNLMSFINTLFSTVLQEHNILYSFDKNYFFKASSSTYYNEQISYIRDKYIKKNIPYDDAKSYLESIYDKMNLNKKEDNNDNQNEALEKKASNNDIKEKEEICYADNYKKSAPFVFNEETYQIQFFNNLDKNYISNFKKDLMNGIFALYYIDEFFHNDDFCIMKKYYNNFINKRSINDSKKLNYPSILKNYRNNLEPSIFIKQYNNYFDDSFLTITHKYVNEDEQLKKFLTKKKSIKLSQKNFYYSESNKEIECELLKNESTFYGKLIYNESENYFLFKEEFKDFTKEEKDPYKYLFLMTYYWQSYNKKRPKSKLFQRKIHNKNVLILIDDIEELVEMRILLLWKGIEIYAKNGKSYLFNFLNTTEYEKFLKEFLLKSKIKHLIRRKYFISEKSNLYKEWIKGLITNHEYILLLNRYGSRSFNDPTQYPVFPWLLNNYKKLEKFNKKEKMIFKIIIESKRLKKLMKDKPNSKNIEIDKCILEKLKEKINKNETNELTIKDYYEIFLNKKKKIKNYMRNFNYPPNAQNNENREKLINSFEEQEKMNKFPFHTAYHYSTSAFIYYYLMRQQPYGNLLLKLQGYTLEDANRCFQDISFIQEIIQLGDDNRELIPEFFSKIEFFLNLNCDYYGICNADKNYLDDCTLEILSNKSNTYLSKFVSFIIYNKVLLNSKIIGFSLSKWIDIIFGEKQLPKDINERKNSCNIFNKCCYEQKINLEDKLIKKLNEKKLDKDMIIKKLYQKMNYMINFGLVPAQIIQKKSHRLTFVQFDNNNISNDSKRDSDIHMDDIEFFIQEGFTSQNREQIIENIPLFFNISPLINKIFIYNKNDNLEIYDSQIFNPIYYRIFDISNFNSIENSYISNYGENYIYEIKYGLSSFDSEKINISDDQGEYHTYYYNRINYLLNIEKIRNQIKSQKKDIIKILTCRHLDYSFKIYYIIKKRKNETTKKIFSYLCEDFVSSCCCLSNNSFVIGLNNGKLIIFKIKFNINDINEKNIIQTIDNIKIQKEKYIQAHKGKINVIEIDKRLGIIITAGDDNYIFIRKLYDLELLLPIKIKNKYSILMVKVSSFNFIYILCFNQLNNKKIIFGYTLSGLRFAKSEYGLYNNININENGDIITLDEEKKEIVFLSGKDLTVIKLSDLNNEKETVDIIQKINPVRWVQYDNYIRVKEDKLTRILAYFDKNKENIYNFRTLNLSA